MKPIVDPNQLCIFDMPECSNVVSGAPSMRNLREYYDRCWMMLFDLGIPVGKVSEIKTSTQLSRWGGCKRLPDGSYSISVNKCLLDPRNSESGLISTLLHELLHTCPGCMNHGDEWQACVNYVNQHYGYNIKAQNNAEEKGVVAFPTRENRAKYVVMCSRCGVADYRLKASKLTQHPEKYRCKKCLGCLIVKSLVDVDEVAEEDNDYA